MAIPSAPLPYDQLDLIADPPPYSTLPQVPPPYTLSIGLESRSSLLKHHDFFPQKIPGSLFGKKKFENLELILDRVNNWLKECIGDIRIVNCETIVWTGLNFKRIYPDHSSFLIEMRAGRRTKYLRGLRLWYLVNEFSGNISANNDSRQLSLEVKTFLPIKNEKLCDMFSRINGIISTEGLPGKILNIETLWEKQRENGSYKPSLVQPNRGFWKSQPDETKTIAICLRIFILISRDFTSDESIAYKDFIPVYSRHSRENDGYEPFQDTFREASDWISRQEGVRFTNIQTMVVKMKKKGIFEERCQHTEHLCATDRFNVFKGFNRTTHYLRIVRVYYTVSISNESLPKANLTFRTFSPLQVVVSGSRQPPQYETMRQIVDRMNTWLKMTYANIFYVETIPINIRSIGGEETYFQRNSNTLGKQRWLYHIRLYLDGQYEEPHGAVSIINPTGNIIPAI